MRANLLADKTGALRRFPRFDASCRTSRSNRDSNLLHVNYQPKLFLVSVFFLLSIYDLVEFLLGMS